MSKSSTIRFVSYICILLTLWCDLKVTKGLLFRALQARKERVTQLLKEKKVVATVYEHPILHSQVEHQMASYLYQRGRNFHDPGLSESEYGPLFQYCLEDLINQHLLRLKTHFNTPNPLSSEHVLYEEEKRNDLLQFSDEYERQDALRRQGYEPGELEARAQSHYEQRQYLSQRIDTTVSEEEIERFSKYKSAPQHLIKTRHLFRSTWQKPVERVEEELLSYLNQSKDGDVTFEELSAHINEDTRAKKQGGNLGWISSTDRISNTFRDALFSLEKESPQFLRSEIGVHYMELLSQKTQKPTNYDLDHVRAYIQNQKRTQGGKLYFKRLRMREKDKIQIYWRL